MWGLGVLGGAETLEDTMAGVIKLYDSSNCLNHFSNVLTGSRNPLRTGGTLGIVRTFKTLKTPRTLGTLNPLNPLMSTSLKHTLPSLIVGGGGITGEGGTFSGHFVVRGGG